MMIETEKIEFKESLSQLSKACESIAAMLNKHGEAEINFGINDQGKVIGVNIGNKTLKDISQEISQRIKPSIIPTINLIVKEEKPIIVITAKGIQKPYSANGIYYIRSGSENKKIEPDLMKEIVFSSSNENMVDIESFEQELSFLQIKQKFILNGNKINTNFEKNASFYTKNGKFNLLANILSDNNDVSIKVIRFATNDKSEIVSRNEFGYKCLLYALDSVLEFVNSLNETRVEIDGSATRKEIRLFDEECFREAWNNACLHTNWSKQIPPIVYIFSDRLEIISTGGLPIDYPIEQFYEGISHPMNRQLQKIMGQLNYIEQMGYGVPLILRKYGKEAFKITQNNIVVTLKFPFNMTMKNTNYTGLSASEKAVLKAINNKPSITKTELEEVVGLKSARISLIIKNLKDLGRISRIGSNKSGYWKINNGLD